LGGGGGGETGEAGETGDLSMSKFWSCSFASESFLTSGVEDFGVTVDAGSTFVDDAVKFGKTTLDARFESGDFE